MLTSEDFRRNPMFLRNQFQGDGVFELPIIKKAEIDLKDVMLIGYDKTKDRDKKNRGAFVHFFLDDYKFEVLWNDPEPRLGKLKQYRGVLSPQFSAYYEMPFSMQLYQTFRSRWCGAYLQSKGLTVIPTVYWGKPQTYWYCFDGIETGGVVAVSTLGVRTEKDFFLQGYHEMLRRLKPKAILCYGATFSEMDGTVIEIDYAETNHLTGHKKYWKMGVDEAGETFSVPLADSKESLHICKTGGVVLSGYGSAGGGLSEVSWKPKKDDDKRFLGEPGKAERYHVDGKKGGYEADVKYGPDGRAVSERHYTDHSQPGRHSSPHDHGIDWSEGFPKPGGPINYDGDAPEFKKLEGRSMEKEYDDRSLTIIPENFASIDDFKECMEHGGEVCFGWKGVDYCCFGCISPSPSEKPKMVISQAGSAEVNLATEMWGDTADEILEYMVGEDRLRDVITQVEVFDRTV